MTNSHAWMITAPAICSYEHLLCLQDIFIPCVIQLFFILPIRLFRIEK
jgi:hypothetical protein